MRALPPAGDRAVVATPSSRQGVSPVPAFIPSAEPAWFKCVRAPRDSGLFTEGVVYEVHSYEGARPLLATDRARKMCSIPLANHEFEPHDPWATYRAAQAIEARRAETQSGSVHESAVRQDAPNPNPLKTPPQTEGPTQ